MKPINILDFNPVLVFWIIVLTIATIICMLITMYVKHWKLDPNESYKYWKQIGITSALLIIITGFQYYKMQLQGLDNFATNPYTIARASQLAPTPSQITKVESLNKLTDKDKENTIVIIFKFGCINCQKLWLEAQKHPELKPSKNVLWVSSREYNKKQSDLVANATHYPSIVSWKKVDNKLIEQRIENPTKDQLESIKMLAKNYTK